MGSPSGAIATLLVIASASLLTACASNDAFQADPGPTIVAQPTIAPQPIHTPDPPPSVTPQPAPTPIDEGRVGWDAVDDAGCVLTVKQMEDVTGMRFDEAIPVKYGYADDRSCSYLWDGLMYVTLYTVRADSDWAGVIREGHESRHSDVETAEIPGATDGILFNDEQWLHMVVGNSYVMVEAYSDEHPTPVVIDVATAVAQELTSSGS